MVTNVVASLSSPTAMDAGGHQFSGRRRLMRLPPRTMTSLGQSLKTLHVVVAILSAVERAPLICSSSVQHDSNQQEPVLQEYCQWETFNATCPGKNEVIIVTAARYGRMRVGRCIPVDYYHGCFADVTEHIEQRCSGRPSCSISVPDAELFRVQPCRKDLVAYFEAAYRCVPVSGLPQSETGSDTVGGVKSTSVCKDGAPIFVKAAPDGYLVSPSLTAYGSSRPGSTHEPLPGSYRCPWLLQAPVGQQINITLMDFTSVQSVSASPSAKTSSGVGQTSGSQAADRSGQHQPDGSAITPPSIAASVKHRQHHVTGNGWCPVVAVFTEDLSADSSVKFGNSDGQLSSGSSSSSIASGSAMTGSGTGRGLGEMTVRACDSRARKRVVYISQTNRLRVFLPPVMNLIGSSLTSASGGVVDSSSAETGSGNSMTQQQWPVYSGHYVLYFKVVGCADINAPENAWVQRRGDTIAVSCNYTSEKWHLVCKGNEWIGLYGNCSGPLVNGKAGHGSRNTVGQQPGKSGSRNHVTSEEAHGISSHLQQFPYGLLVAIAIGAVVGIVVGCIFLLTVFAFRKRLNRGERGQSSIMGTGCYDDMTPGGGVVLLNHDNSAMAAAASGGYGLIGDCTLTGSGSSAYHHRESNAYKTTADLLKLCSRATPATSTGGYYHEHGNCLPPEIISETVRSRSVAAARSSSGGVYTTSGSCRYTRTDNDHLQARWADPSADWVESRGNGVEFVVNEDDDDNEVIGKSCTCGRYGSTRFNDADCHSCRDRLKTPPTVDDMLQHHEVSPTASTAGTAPNEISYTEELVRRQMTFSSAGGGGGCGVHPPDGLSASSVQNHATGTPPLYDCVMPGLRDAELVMRTFKGSPTRGPSQQYLATSVATSKTATLPRAMVSGSGSTSDSGYDTSTYRISPTTNGNHVCS